MKNCNIPVTKGILDKAKGSMLVNKVQTWCKEYNLALEMRRNEEHTIKYK